MLYSKTQLADTKGLSKIAKRMESEEWCILTVVLIRVNGKMIECMVMVNFSILMEKLHTKVIGCKMSSVELDVSSIKFLKILIETSL